MPCVRCLKLCLMIPIMLLAFKKFLTHDEQISFSANVYRNVGLTDYSGQTHMETCRNVIIATIRMRRRTISWSAPACECTIIGVRPHFCWQISLLLGISDLHLTEITRVFGCQQISSAVNSVLRCPRPHNQTPPKNDSQHPFKRTWIIVLSVARGTINGHAQ